MDRLRTDVSSTAPVSLPMLLRQLAMLMRRVDDIGVYDDEPAPDVEWVEQALAKWRPTTIPKRAKLIFPNSAFGPNVAYEGAGSAV